MITTLCKKSTQALNYFARKKGGQINKMKAIKLIYFADRYHLRKYGRPIIGDTYWAMKLGAVGSNLLNIAKFDDVLEKDCLRYARNFLVHNKGDAKLLDSISKKEVDLNVFSQTDIEALEIVYEELGDKDQFELADLTHDYPEWFKHKKDIESGKKRRASMDYLDFFSNPRKSRLSLFDISDEHLKSTKNIYKENLEAELALG